MSGYMTMIRGIHTNEVMLLHPTVYIHNNKLLPQKPYKTDVYDIVIIKLTPKHRTDSPLFW